jgi:two-component system, chemotaxis family, protein-glutamate methylesterase/glutaminase
MMQPAFESISGRTIQAVIVGASAGGIDAMLHIFSALPVGYRLPIIALLHVPDERQSRLAELFEHRLAIPVKEAGDKEEVTPGTLHFASSGYHLSIEHDHTFSFSCEPPVHFSRPSIDILMESAADTYGDQLAGILLTGANFDGAAGLKKIKEYGGLTIVQDPEEAQVAVMPREAIKYQVPDFVLPLAKIRELLLLLDHVYGKN